MALPHFTQNLSTYSFAPIYKNLCEVNFGKDFEILGDNCYKIEKDVAYFHINSNKMLDIEDNIIKFVKGINKDNKIQVVEHKRFDKDGKVILFTIIEDFYFTKIANLLDFDWNTVDDIMKLEVRFKYDNIKILNDRDYKKYIRKIKIQQIDK